MIDNVNEHLSKFKYFENLTPPRLHYISFPSRVVVKGCWVMVQWLISVISVMSVMCMWCVMCVFLCWNQIVCTACIHEKDTHNRILCESIPVAFAGTKFENMYNPHRRGKMRRSNSDTSIRSYERGEDDRI